MAIDRSRTETTRDFTAHTHERIDQYWSGSGLGRREGAMVCAPFLAMA